MLILKNNHIKIKLIILTLILFSMVSVASFNKGKLDSLYTIYKNAANDTISINAHLKIIDYLMKNDSIRGKKEIKKLEYKLNKYTNDDFVFKSYEALGKICYKSSFVNFAKFYFRLGILKSKEKNKPNWTSRFYYRIAEMMQHLDLSKQSIPYFDSALSASKTNNENYLSKVNMLKGRAHYDVGDYRKAMDHYIISQKLFEKNKLYNEDYGRLLHFIGSVFKRQDMFDKALGYYEKELQLALQIKSKGLEAEALYLCAAMYGSKGDLNKELEFELKALKIYKEENNLRSVALMLGNISSNYADRKNYAKAIEYCEEALKMYIDQKQTEKVSWVYGALGGYYSKLGQFKKALTYLNKALEFTKKTETKQLLYKTDFTRSMAFAYAGMGDYKSAFNKYLEYGSLNDSISNFDNKKYLNDLEKKYDTEKKEREIALLSKDKLVQQTELAKQKTQQQALIIGCILVMIIAAISITAFISNRRKSKLLGLKVNEINHQNLIIKEKNKDITDSILYAKRLQEAVLPLAIDLHNYFPESFILFKPKDIVSGDFYWFENVNGKMIFIVGDSTGHGVPGAFMSILGHNLLNQIILEEKITEPSEILSLLDKRITNALNKKGSKQEYNDGMDIGVCVIDKQKNKLYFSGANRPLVIKREDKIFELKQNKYAIGGLHLTETKVFVQHEIDTIKNDSLYLFSDGYYDQFGGPRGKKYKFKKLQELLLAHAHQPMHEQLELINQSFENWKGNLEQIDDVCVIGIRL